MLVRKVSLLTSLGNGDIDMWHEENYVLVIDEMKDRRYISMWRIKVILDVVGKDMLGENLIYGRAYVVIPKKKNDAALYDYS